MDNDNIARRFLGEKRFAFVGVSRDPSDFSRVLFRELRRRGYQVVPVNPALDEVEGGRCYRRVQDVVPAVAAAFVMTPAARSVEVVKDCLEAGVRMVWLHRGVGRGSVNPEAVRLCRSHGVEVAEGCPYMYLPNASAFHRVHGFFRRFFGARAA
jgi:predicted CoA-binding protein